MSFVREEPCEVPQGRIEVHNDGEGEYYLAYHAGVRLDGRHPSHLEAARALRAVFDAEHRSSSSPSPSF